MAPTIHLLRTILPAGFAQLVLSLEFLALRSGSGRRRTWFIGVARVLGFQRAGERLAIEYEHLYTYCLIEPNGVRGQLLDSALKK